MKIPFWRGFLDGLSGGPLWRWLGRLTWLGVLNFLVLQWFGVRLARAYRIEQYGHRADYVTMMPDGSFSLAMSAKTRRVPDGYRLRRWIVPLTGWWSEYRWIARRP